MEYLSDKKKVIKIPLQFDCPRCRGTVISNYLHFGEELACPHCREIIAVPETAVVTSEDSNVLDIWRIEKAAQIPQRKPTKAEKIKKRYSKINAIVGFVASIAFYSITYKIVTSELYRILLSIAIGFLVSYTVSTFEQQEKDSTPKSVLDKEAE